MFAAETPEAGSSKVIFSLVEQTAECQRGCPTWTRSVGVARQCGGERLPIVNKWYVGEGGDKQEKCRFEIQSWEQMKSMIEWIQEQTSVWKTRELSSRKIWGKIWCIRKAKTRGWEDLLISRLKVSKNSVEIRQERRKCMMMKDYISELKGEAWDWRNL